MRMRQETFKKSYYIPAFGKSIEIRRNQDIDEEGVLGKELLAQYGEDCILEGETKSLMEKIASGDISGGGTSLTTEQTDAIAKIEGLEVSASEIDGSLIDTSIELITNINRGFINKLTGLFSTSNNWRSTDFISVTEGETLTISGTISGTGSVVLLGYNEEETIFTPLTLLSNNVGVAVTIPSGVVKVRGTTVYNKEFSITRNTKVPRVLKQAKKTWTSIGDSITFRYGYQPVINNTLQFKNIINEGYSGEPLTNYGGQGSIIVSTVGMIEADLYTIMVGTNDFKLNVPIGTTVDYINNTGNTTFYGAFRQLIDRCYTLNSKCKIILFNILRRNNASYTSYSTNVAGHTVSDYNAAIKWVAEYEALEYLDLFNTSGITDRNLGTYTEDGLHPNPLGYSLIAKQMITKFYSIWQ